MTQPVLAKQTFLIAILAGVQAILPAVVAVAFLYATIIVFEDRFDPSSSAIVIVAVLCLVLVQSPREVSSQLTSPRLSAVVDVIVRWLLLLAVLLAIGMGNARYFQNCTPSFYNSEQQAIDQRAARNLTYTGSLLEYVGYLERWRQPLEFAGVKVQHGEPVEPG